MNVKKHGLYGTDFGTAPDEYNQIRSKSSLGGSVKARADVTLEYSYQSSDTTLAHTDLSGLEPHRPPCQRYTQSLDVK